MRPPKRWNERFTVEGLVLCAVYLAGMVGAVVWGISLEEPYPCSGRHNCSAEVLR